jgi:VWFA-related protein
MKVTYVRFILLLVLSAAASAQTLRLDVQVVEVYVSASDGSRRPVTNLKADDFRILEEGVPQTVQVFEPQTTAMTVALIIDTTGSMVTDLPKVKNSVSRLLTSLKPSDKVGLFTFANRLTPLSPITTDRKVTLDALLKVRAAGNTALYDSLAQLSRELSPISGKKSILLFTDGDDNASTLTLDASLQQVRRAGVPIYTMLYGRALTDSVVFKGLAEISSSTGGSTFKIRDADELSKVFQQIGNDLQFLYLLAYQSSVHTEGSWRSLSVSLPAQPKIKLKSKEGYWR